jgi:serine/threonine-protein kinase RsbW
MQFQADLSTLNQIMEYLRAEAVSCGMSEKAILKMELASEEAIVNIISYAYPEKKGILDISCSRMSHRFEIVIKDKGIPFNPIDAEVGPELDRPIQERKLGGLGIFLIRKVIDEASYQRVGDENLLRLAFIV